MPISKLSSSLDDVRQLLASHNAFNAVPLFCTLPSELLSPVAAFLRLTDGCTSTRPSFLLESCVNGAFQGRYSFLGIDPLHVIRTGEGEEHQGDPLVVLQSVLDRYKPVPMPGLPPFSGGAVGMIGYDCVRHFDPKAFEGVPDVASPLDLPEAALMVCDTVIAFDHLHKSLQIVTHVVVNRANPMLSGEMERQYEAAVGRIRRIESTLSDLTAIKEPPQPPIVGGTPEATSNIGREGYEAHVARLKQHIVRGDIIQAVPSQRLTRPTTLHPFNAYRHLRRLNPSPYMFYVDCGRGLQLVGASPECLCKVDGDKVYNHAIAGTIKRGATAEEDERLAQELSASGKDAAEHVMLVDLARNDVNRVCKPETVQIDSFMAVERFSHVMHLTSKVSGRLRADKTRWDAFRSIFPAGTVSGAPKIRAMQLISEIEQERRFSYAGAIGHFSFGDSDMDTAIAIRTMVFHDGQVSLQAGGGITSDSDEHDEYVETLNKLASSLTALKTAEAVYASTAETD